MTIPKSTDVVLQGALVLKVRATNAEPQLPTILLMRAPVTPYCKCLTTFSTHERLDPVLSLVMCLQRPKIFQWFRPWVLDIVAAPLCTAVAR